MKMKADSFTKLGWFIAGFLLGISVTFVAFRLASPVKAVQQDKLNICHLTHSETNPWVAQQINANELQSHLDNGDFLYGGPLKSNGHPENANHQADNWCFDNAPHHFACNEDNACARVEGKGDSSCEVDKDCETPPPPVDACLNLSGFQETVPANMVANSDHFCSCASGFHEVPVEDSKDFTCVADPGNPPSDNNGGGGGSTGSTNTTSAPSCPDGSTTKAVANFFVTRDGSHATVNFFITEGNSANIYYSQVGQPHWQYSVIDVKPNGDNFVSYTVNDLDPKVGYDFGAQQKFGCGGGQIATGVVVDGPEERTFGFSYWIW